MKSVDIKKNPKRTNTNILDDEYHFFLDFNIGNNLRNNLYKHLETCHPDFCQLNSISKLKFRRRVLQPIPKGDNLVECIADIVQMLTELRSAIGLNTSMIQQMDGFLSNHAHPMASPAFTAPVSSYTAVTGIVQGKGASSILDEEMFGKKTASFVNSFLKPTDGRDTNLNPRFINSNFVFTT